MVLTSSENNVITKVSQNTSRDIILYKMKQALKQRNNRCNGINLYYISLRVVVTCRKTSFEATNKRKSRQNITTLLQTGNL